MLKIMKYFQTLLLRSVRLTSASLVRSNGLPILTSAKPQRWKNQNLLFPRLEHQYRPFSSGVATREPENKDCRFTSAHPDPNNKLIKVEWQKGKFSDFPFVWLRDNCQCKDCFHPVSLSRTLFIKDLDVEICPKTVEIVNNGSSMKIIWSDGHVSHFEAQWVRERAFEKDQREERIRMQKLQRLPWKEELPVVNWTEIIEKDEALLRWLELLETYGLVMIEGAPEEPGHTRTLAERVAFIKPTHYGEVFSVIAKPGPSNVAYSTSALALHMDLPYYLYKPGVQLIHCVHQYDGEGGDSQVSDALMVAEYLRLHDAQTFHILSTTLVDWVDRAVEEGREYFKMLSMPIICLDTDQKTIVRINFSQPQRDSFFTQCSVEEVTQWYRALKKYHDLLYDKMFCRTFKMKPGTLMTLDNLRVTHGRTAYPDSNDVRRHIEGCYIDWDEVRSRRRVLSLKYGASKQ